MNCGECQEILSRFIDGDLDEKRSAGVSDHLAVCAECTLLCDDLAQILLQCRETENAEALPPNPAALWRRINNLIESELPAEIPVEEKPRGWFARGWNLTFSQAGAAVLGIALVSSLLTIVSIRNYIEPPGNDLPAQASEPPSTMQRLLSKVGLAETQQQARERRIKEQQAAIEYWDKRVQMRRMSWDHRMRAAFDRNLFEIEQAVNEYTLILQKDPEDQLSEEMLDSALTEKMNLLRQFSEL
ncbi:MAG TPA: zf-HC2 domain-containing protein [Pyrinomonadaceae bacterium]|nr:zf-HC2 domain-containing protein [Pyrinomonadaceae bacterium]